MKKLICIVLVLIFYSGEIALAAEYDNYWKLSTISNIGHYLSKEENETLLSQCDRFLNMPEMLSINTSPTIAQFDQTLLHIKAAKQPLVLLNPENTVIGSLICGLGGGPNLSVVFEKDSKRAIAVVLIPGM